MNRLALVQRLAVECAVGSTPSGTTSQSGESARLVNWIDQAWAEIQTKYDDWEWMRSSNVLGAGASFVTVAAQASYPLGSGGGTVGVTAANFGKWKAGTFRLYLTSAGTSNETELEDIRFDYWRDVYMLGANRSVTTRPTAIAIGPNKSLCLGPPPTVGYTVTGDYYVAPSAMAVDADLPTGLPAQFHMAIVYLAMTYYAGYEAAPEVLSRGQGGYEKLMRQLSMDDAPEISFGGALA